MLFSHLVDDCHPDVNRKYVEEAYDNNNNRKCGNCCQRGPKCEITRREDLAREYTFRVVQFTSGVHMLYRSYVRPLPFSQIP